MGCRPWPWYCTSVCAGGVARRVGVHSVRQAVVGRDEHRRSGDSALQLLHRLLLRVAPHVWYVVLEQLGQRRGDAAEGLDKATVVASQPEEGTQLAHVLGLRPLGDGLDLVRLHADAFCAHDMTEERDAALKELTLAELGVQLVLSQDLQHLAHVLRVFVARLAEHEDVIEEHDHKLVEQRAEQILHQVHERGRRIGETERHD